MNQVVASATITRSNTQQVKIVFGKTGDGDDIVDQWGDRMIESMQAGVACAARQSRDAALPTALRTLPGPEHVERYYFKIFACLNCGCLNMLWFVKGRHAPESVQCEKCECDTAKNESGKQESRNG